MSTKEIAAAAKAKGNAALAAKDYDAAISAYTEAIKVRLSSSPCSVVILSQSSVPPACGVCCG